MKIKCLSKFAPVIQKEKRIKILVGGRASLKSTFASNYILSCMSQGQLACGAREFQNSIDESVHRLLLDEIDRLGFQGFHDSKTDIKHESGGRIFYRGLARNVTAVKSLLTGVDVLWIEEGESLSFDTLRVLTASLRLSAADVERKMRGEKVKMPEIIITMNRGSSADPIAQEWLARAEPDLERCGYYEDDNIMVIEANYNDLPDALFKATGLESERLDDYENKPRAFYDHKWLGKYLDTVDNAIIMPEWFDAAIDAHKLDRLKNVFKSYGAKVAALDPSDGGEDAGGFALRHGSIITHVDSRKGDLIDDVCDWGTSKARELGADCFVWDGDGMGTGLRRQVSDAFTGTSTAFHMFKGSLSGSAQDNAEKEYIEVLSSESSKRKKYKDTFKNNRAQYYIALANRFKNTYKCVVKGEYVDPDEMISLSSDGIADMMALRSQLCRIPRKSNSNGLEWIMSKVEMKALKIASPNEGDAVMMTMVSPAEQTAPIKLNFPGWG